MNYSRVFFNTTEEKLFLLLQNLDFLHFNTEPTVMEPNCSGGVVGPVRPRSCTEDKPLSHLCSQDKNYNTGAGIINPSLIIFQFL